MNPESSNSAEIHRCLVRLREGDPLAQKELLETAKSRLIRLAHKMLSDFPGVRRWEETDDVFQNAMIRLCRTLEQIVPDSVAAFISLAARDMRCALIDLARHYYGPQGAGTHHHSASDAGSRSRRSEAMDNTNEPTTLAFWSEFHENVQNLPTELQQIMDILWYQGLNQTEAASLLNLSERTVQRRWRQACLSLHDSLNRLPPGL